MITYIQAIHLHTKLIQQFGGLEGIRDHEGLRSALSRPFQTFNNNQLYPTQVEKAAALIESILQNHPFVDGNKRTGYVLMRVLLLQSALDIRATQDEKYIFVISIATGKLKYENILQWLKEHLI